MTRSYGMRSLGLVMLLATAARADDFIGVDRYGTLGLGLVIDDEDSASYDYTLRVGQIWRASDRLRPGGFLELHSYDLESFDASIGPQLQLRLGDQLALQLRGGAGLGSEGTHALVGVQLGTYYLGASVTARRDFSSGDIAVTMNIEFLALVPVAIGIALGSK